LSLHIRPCPGPLNVIPDSSLLLHVVIALLRTSLIHDNGQSRLWLHHRLNNLPLPGLL